MTAPSSTSEPSSADPGPAILIVDDLPQNLLALEATLESLKVPIIRAGSGEEALRQLLSRDFALIILDVQMPGLDGLQTAELIKKREVSAHIPIIFITALSREAAYVFKGYAEGAVDYLLKPIDPEIVRAKASVFVELFRRGERLKRQAKLVAASEAKDEFIAAVTHEIRTPLTAAKAQTQLAIRQLGGRTEPSTRALGLISKHIDRVVRLVEELLDFTRIQSGRLMLHRRGVDLAASAREVIERMASLSDNHTLAVHAEGEVIVSADPDRLEQILTNLVANAIRYSPEGGEILIEVSASSAHAHVAVRDSGMGIPEEKLAIIFDRFTQAHGSAYGGLGLGLTITRELVVRHGGRIWAESAGIPGKGSVFHVELPQGKAPAA